MELPQEGEGLRWIANQEPAQILLIPGVHSASVAAAGEGDQEAVAYLRFAAQYFVAHGSMQNLNQLDTVCLAGSAITAAEPFRVFWSDLQARDERLKRAYSDRRSATHKILKKAAQEGQLAALKWLRALCHRSFEDNQGLVRLAAEHGHLDVMKYLRRGPRPAPFDTGIYEASICHPECFQWLMSDDLPGDLRTSLIGQVAKHGSFELLRWLCSGPLANPYAYTEEVMLAIAARPDCLPTVQWLRTLQPPVRWSAAVCEAAAGRGDISLLQWLRGQVDPCPWTANCCTAAINSRQLETLQWMIAQQPPCPFSEDCTSAAVRNRDQPMLRWLRAQDPPCPLESACCRLAAENGDLPMLQLLRALEPPCPINLADCIHIAVQRGDLAMLEWLVDSRQGLILGGIMYYHAAAAGHLHLLRWLRARAVPAPSGSVTNVSLPAQNNTAALMFLGDIGAPLQPRARQDLQQARRTLVTFHGLLRWCRGAVSNPAKGIHRAFDPLRSNTSGQNLLIRLSMLPPELVNKIAVAAGLQHDLI